MLNALRTAEKSSNDLSDDEELQVLQRERKRRQEAYEAYEAAGRGAGRQGGLRARSAGGVHAEPLSEDDVERIVDDAIAEVGATSMRDLGRVMADVMPQVAGRADGSVVSQIVREKLAYGGLGETVTMPPERTGSPSLLCPRSPTYVQYAGSLRPTGRRPERPGDEHRSPKPS